MYGAPSLDSIRLPGCVATGGIFGKACLQPKNQIKKIFEHQNVEEGAVRCYLTMAVQMMMKLQLIIVQMLKIFPKVRQLEICIIIFTIMND